MDRPAKRLKVGQAAYDAEEDEDELGLEPEEFVAKQDPGYQLEKGRAIAAHKLKSTFEHIFEKYEKDFTGIGDEIDLRTGDIVVDNGHLHSMRDAQDTGEDDRGQVEGADDQDDANTSEEEDRILLGASPAKNRPMKALSRPKASASQLGTWPRLTSLMGGGPRLSSMFSPRFPFMGAAPPPLGSFGFGAGTMDTAWSVPELPPAAFNTAFRPNYAVGGAKSRQINKKTVIRKSLQGPEDADAEDDDILLGVGRTDLHITTQTKTVPDSSKDVAATADTADGATNLVVSDDGVMPDAAEDATVVAQLQPVSTENGEKGGHEKQHPRGGATGAETGNGKKTSKRRHSQLKRHDDVAVVDIRPEKKRKPKRGRPVVVEQKLPQVRPVKENHDTATNTAEKAITRPTTRRRRAAAVEQKPAEVRLVKDHHGPVPESAEESRPIPTTKRRPVIVEQKLPEAQSVEKGRDPTLNAVEENPPVSATRRSRRSETSSKVLVVKSQKRPRPGSKPQPGNKPGSRRSLREETRTEVHDIPQSASKKMHTKKFFIEIVLKKTDNRETATAIQALEDEGSTVDTSTPFINGLAPPVPSTQDIEEVPDPSASVSRASMAPVNPPESVEAFSRNIVDPSYTFSDEDEAMPLRKIDKDRCEQEADSIDVAEEEIAVAEETTTTESFSITARVSPEIQKAKVDRRRSSKRLRPPDTQMGGNKGKGREATKEGKSTIKDIPPATQQPTPPKDNPHTSPRQDISASTSSPTPGGTEDQPKVKSKAGRRPKSTTKQTASSPKTPQGSSNTPNITTPDTAKTPPSRTSLISLVSDDEEDELSLGPDDFSHSFSAHTSAARNFLFQRGASSSSRPTSTPRRKASGSLRRSLLLSSHSKKTGGHAPAQHGDSSPLGPGRGLSSGKDGRRKSSGGVLAGSAGSFRRHSTSPVGSLVRTPGGTMRRCGEDGFRCDRDFCFICM
ncbi:hypothetical protein NKR23_g2612 [Pleurostoma richardsiae]|uniref:Uncharacterized protein n=1 Tax=Pleurostoma richardsiae TaxID=41990 RepID=A0AA38VHV4_9PEZI|nr:hypothetical protein NKR23_g2612 [Pleurostoma richardsiae]